MGTIQQWMKKGQYVGLMLMMVLVFPATLWAQSDSLIKSDSQKQREAGIPSNTVDMATTMRSNGKIYVVVAVLSIILIGIFLYLIRLDRKISRIEKTKND